MFEDIAVGNYSQMSFAFTVDEDEYIFNEKEGTDTRVIKSIRKLFDISAVSFPANPGTDIGVSARAIFDGEIEKRKAERLEREKREREKKRLELRLKLEGETNNGN
jgi:phage head maturation protease